MIGVVVRGISILKLLQPIMIEFNRLGEKYIIYHLDIPRGSKEYDRASISNINKSSKSIVDNAYKVRAFGKEKTLIDMMVEDGITKYVGSEIGFVMQPFIPYAKSKGIKFFSIQYMTDSLVNGNKKHITDMDKVYYTTSYIMKMQHELHNINFNPNRDVVVGSPIFDALSKVPSSGDNILVLLPSVYKPEFISTFGSDNNFMKIIESLNSKYNVIFKTRKKHYFPKSIDDNMLYFDDNQMYPSKIVSLLQDSFMTIMFNSTGVYEAVCGGNYVVNINVPMDSWVTNAEARERTNKFFNSDLFNYNGVIKNIKLNDIISGNIKVEPARISHEAMTRWIDLFVGPVSECSTKIARDILNA